MFDGSIAIEARSKSFHTVDIEVGFDGVAVAAGGDVAEIVGDSVEGGCGAYALRGPQQEGEFLQSEGLFGEVSMAATFADYVDDWFLSDAEFFRGRERKDLCVRWGDLLHIRAWGIACLVRVE